jgi:YaaC-like Protein
MESPRPFSGWVQRIPSPTGVVAIMSEPLNAPLLWRLLKGWSDVPERGRTLFAPPMTNQNRLLAEFRAFVRQAESYYETARQTRGVSAALPLYYFALNLAKAELLVRAPARIVGGARIDHGLSTRFGRTTNALADRVAVSDGVFTVLYRHRVGAGLGRQLIPIQRVLRNIPEIGYEMQEMGDRPGAAQVFHSMPVNDSEIWSLLAIPRIAAIMTNSISSHELSRHFVEVTTPANASRIFAMSERWGPVTAHYRYFESRLPIPVQGMTPTQVPETAIVACATATWRQLRTLMDDVAEGTGDLVATPSLYRSRLVPLPASLARYAALFYASEVVRYRPARLDPATDATAAWLFESLVSEVPKRLLASALGHISGTRYLFYPSDVLRG